METIDDILASQATDNASPWAHLINARLLKAALMMGHWGRLSKKAKDEKIVALDRLIQYVEWAERRQRASVEVHTNGGEDVEIHITTASQVIRIPTNYLGPVDAVGIAAQIGYLFDLDTIRLVREKG